MARGRGGLSPAVRPASPPGRGVRPPGRSRSPRLAPSAAGPLRKDAPVRRQHTSGSIPDLSTEAARASALEDLVMDIYAPSNRASVASRIRLCERVLAMWGLPALPPSARTISALGASLKAGGYRSASVYLSCYKTWSARHGHEWTAVLQQAFQDAVRSCERGLGGPVKARALPFDRLGSLPGGDTPWVPGGPLRPRNAMVLGAWFLTREIELSAASAAALEVSFPRPGVPQVRFHLPASKNDLMAVGTAREHGCACLGTPVPFCPAHTAWDHLSFLRDRFPAFWHADSTPLDLPLFPTSSGTACSKEAMTSTIIHAANLLGVELASPDGSERVSGHSLRATGAQGLAASGVDTWAIELLGRWGGDTVRSYVREARLANASSMAKRVKEAVSLEELVNRILDERAGAQSPPTVPALAALATPAQVALQPAPVGTPGASAAASSTGPWLAAPLAAEIAAAQAVRATTPSDARFVVNLVTGVAHRILIGFEEVSPHEWLAACGWKFGLSTWRSGPAQLARAELPRAPQLLCARCLPDIRRQALDDLARLAG